MTFIRRGLVVILVLAFIVIFGEIALANGIAKNQELIQPPIKTTEASKDISHNPPRARDRKDIDRGKLGENITPDLSSIPHNPNSTKEQKINEFAWRDFVALNWPANCQGKPLEHQLIGQAPEAPRVWELYPSPKDVFQPNGATPPSEQPEDKKCLGDRKGSEIEYKPNLRLTETGDLVKKEEFSAFEIASRKDLLAPYGELKSELNIDGKLVIISVEDLNGAIKIPLVDRQGNYVINEVRMNPLEYNQIRDNKWYDATQLVELIKSKKQFNLACSKGYETESKKYCNQGYQDEGAIEIKPVWRVLDERNSAEQKARYYSTTRQIVIPDESSPGQYKVLQQVELGLIGFHIMHKTSQLGWVWSTFEHIDNTPSCGDHKTKPYTLYNNKCKTGNCKENFPYVKEPYHWRISNNEPKAVTLEGIAVTDKRSEIKDQIPSQICRANEIRDSAKKENENWQNSLRAIDKSSVWQYYQLIGTQWLQNPELPYSNWSLNRRKITPLETLPNKRTNTLTNTALESYAQGVSCILCHTSARLPGNGSICQLMVKKDELDKIKACADFSFLMDKAQFSLQLSTEQN